MIDREFRKRLRLLQGRSETITTRFELTDAGRLVEHVSLETHDRRTGARADTRLVPVERRAWRLISTAVKPDGDSTLRRCRSRSTGFSVTALCRLGDRALYPCSATWT